MWARLRKKSEVKNMKEKALKLWWFTSGALTGLSALSIASGSVPSKSRITDDTAIYQNLSEIRVAREADLNFDGDIARLSTLEKNYKEKLPALARSKRVKKPMKRIAERKYRYSGKPVKKLSASKRSKKPSRVVRQ